MRGVIKIMKILTNIPATFCNMLLFTECKVHIFVRSLKTELSEVPDLSRCQNNYFPYGPRSRLVGGVYLYTYASKSV